MPPLNQKTQEAIYRAGKCGYRAFRKTLKDAGGPESKDLPDWHELGPVTQGAWAVAILRGAEPLVVRDTKEMLENLSAQIKKMADKMGETEDLKPKTF